MESVIKLNILRLVVAVVFCISILVVITHVGAQKPSLVNHEFDVSMLSLGMAMPAQTPAATVAPQEKTVDQTRKNIKVLTGMPDSQLIPVMNFFGASLGVRCDHCHAAKDGNLVFEADDKPEKQTAREMIKMVLSVNKDTFRGATAVSCYTCHRGRTMPLSVPQFPLPTPTPRPQASPAAATGQTTGLPTADQIFDKYITALGGQAAIDKLKTRIMKGTFVGTVGPAFPFEVYQAAPDKFALSMTRPQGTAEVGYNGSVGWEKSPRGIREIPSGNLASLKTAYQLFRNIKLKEQFTRTRVQSKEKIGERDAYVIAGTTADNRVERLFFDVETGLLLRRITYLRMMIGVIPEQTDFEDYRDVDGVKFPFTVRVASTEPGNAGTRKFSEIKVNVPIDDTKFNMPAAPPKVPNP